ncbi:MAG: hypothetical protein ACFFEF_02845 [Candidatus Thorarchaeota archaeon]
MKTRRMHLIAGFTMFALCISVCTTTSEATVIWEDNFDDGVLDGWTLFKYENLVTSVKDPGNFSAADFTLKVLDDDMNFARHNSIVNVGNWSFDMFVPNNEYEDWAMYVYIMSNGSRQIPTYPSDFIAVGAWKRSTSHSATFIAWTMKGSGSDIQKSITRDPLQGWHHIVVSRNSDGRFLVYFNGTLEADFTYNGVTTSTYLEFYCYNVAGAAIDNVVVEEVVPPSTELPWELIVIGGSAAVAIIVLAIVFLRRR